MVMDGMSWPFVEVEIVAKDPQLSLILQSTNEVPSSQ